jgi:hypothetical protein
LECDLPIALMVIGIALLVSALRGTEKTLGQQLVSDMTGSGSYVDWVAAIIIIGLLGYIPSFQTPSRALLGLILLVFIVSNNGVFSKLTQALQQTTAPVAQTSAEATNPLAGPVPVQIVTAGSGGILGSILGSVTNSVTGAATKAATNAITSAGTGGL